MSEKTVTVVLEKENNGIRAAFLENGIVVSFYFQSNANDVRVGDLFIGRVLNNRFSQVGWFIDLGDGQSGFLPHHKQRPDHTVKPGDRILIQVDKEERDGKVPELTEQVQIKGKRLIFLPFSPYVAVSRRLPEYLRERLKNIVSDWCATGEGAIIRTQASEQNVAAIQKEFNSLKEKARVILRAAEHVSSEKRILRQYSFAAALLNENHFPPKSTVIANFLIDQDELPPNTTFMYKEHQDLFRYFNLESAYKAALRPYVPFESGASLMIEYTEALTAIDVNSGSMAIRSNWEETALHINLAAAKEIARQLRLRQIGGMVVVDFLRMEKDENRQQLLHKLECLTKNDPNAVHVFGFTRLGLVELVRKRQRCGVCDRFMKTE
ncbi:ribonuclease E/G [Sporolactobacillus shoreicorticis]|uniref:Ribonuclease E/G n=1 Tax=Sporolactobacillus shoreicorticis TaxID=1923877 RepID=A0ABW5RXV4_9BACL|nr:ribonuclease E/G [Sporolactobacillus shoreicorticis]MCO7127953.1 ribonuclease E/G [Sporolactobacillus shoreicorticis]